MSAVLRAVTAGTTGTANETGRVGRGQPDDRIWPAAAACAGNVGPPRRGTPDFSSVHIPRAGSVARPAVDADPEAIRDLAYSIIRVLNRDGEAVGPWAGLEMPLGQAVVETFGVACCERELVDRIRQLVPSEIGPEPGKSILCRGLKRLIFTTRPASSADRFVGQAADGRGGQQVDGCGTTAGLSSASRLCR